jgi:hypothetical protein
MVACNKGIIYPHPATRPLPRSLSVMLRMVFDITHTHTFGPSQDIQLLVVIVATARTVKSYLMNAIRQLFTDRAAASALKVTAPSRIQVAAANIRHGPRCSSVAGIQFIQ